jgi:biopolymer transport protein ExbD
MSWQVRHEGSPNATKNLTAQQVLVGVTEGVWEPSDEVRGPADTDWRSIESHPHFEEAIQEIELPDTGHHDDETHLDMNPLIDVALVLLIFFIITASYDALKKVINMPSMSAKGGTPRVINDKSEICKVEAFLGPDGKTVIYKVDGEEIPEDKIGQGIGRAVAQKRSKVLIDVKDVRWDNVVKIIDAGQGNGATKFMMRVEDKKQN